MEERVKKQFPSPCGDYGSYLGHGQPKSGRALVSVPLRGLWFLSRKEEKNMATYEDIVSVPLRGLWFLSNTS